MLIELIIRVLIVLALSIGIILLVWHISMFRIQKKYKQKYESLVTGLYRFDSISSGNAVYFKKHDYVVENAWMDYNDREIIFFSDGSIKLEENLYIHKSLILFHLAGWYYWFKFQNLKDEIVRDHNFREAYRRMVDHSRMYENRKKLNFKFLRGW